MKNIFINWWSWLWKSHENSQNKLFSNTFVQETILSNYVKARIFKKKIGKNIKNLTHLKSSKLIYNTSNLNNNNDQQLKESQFDFPSNLNEYSVLYENFSILNDSITAASKRESSVKVSFDEIGELNNDGFFYDFFFNCTSLENCCILKNETLFTTLGFNENFFNTGANNNSLEYDNEDGLELFMVVGTTLLLVVVILATIIGNVFVITAILLERNLQNVSNYLILSLAVADLLVACLVMPLSAVYEVSKEWKLGPELCDMWTSCDVLCCTASILHLVAIALDRYWAVTNVDYIHQRTARRVGYMILIIWVLSFLVSIAPLMGWKDSKWQQRVSLEMKCMVSQDLGYQIFATASSFYVPLLVVLVFYWRIFQTARKRIRKKQQVTENQSGSCGVIATAAGGSGGIAAAVISVIGRPLPTISETTTALTNLYSRQNTSDKGSCSNNSACADFIDNDPATSEISTNVAGQISTPTYKLKLTRKKAHNSVDSKRERKAAKTLAIITGAFVFCWLPFFVIAILLPICNSCRISPHIMSLCLWLGYFNSTLNPIIYTIFSPEFRNAFKRILCGRGNNFRRRNNGV